MTVKFKVGFTVTGETLVGLIARMLPIEDLSVEELAPAVASRLSDRLEAPKSKRQSPPRPKLGPNLDIGINGIIIPELKEGPKRGIQLQSKVSAAGYSQHSVPSRLEELRKNGVVERVGDGTWRLK